jgi:hypothetical protein
VSSTTGELVILKQELSLDGEQDFDKKKNKQISNHMGHY